MSEGEQHLHWYIDEVDQGRVEKNAEIQVLGLNEGEHLISLKLVNPDHTFTNAVANISVVVVVSQASPSLDSSLSEDAPNDDENDSTPEKVNNDEASEIETGTEFSDDSVTLNSRDGAAGASAGSSGGGIINVVFLCLLYLLVITRRQRV